MPRRKNRPRNIPIPKKKRRQLEDNGEWKRAPANQNRLTAVPREIHLKILEHLSPIDIVCLSLANKYLYMLLSPRISHIPLTLGGLGTYHPVFNTAGCHHCLPVLYHPAHCELHFHLRGFVPEEMKFCSSCEKFTRCEDRGFSDSHEICGACGTGYLSRFERGRRLIDMGRKRGRPPTPKWYNGAVR